MFNLVQKATRNVLAVIIRVDRTKVRQLNNLQCTRHMSISQPLLAKSKVKVTFVRLNGEKIQVTGQVGENLLDLVNNNGIEIEGFGACDGTLTCSTCHLILKKEDYDALPNKPSSEERDMLDMAADLTNTSRLGCQIILSEDLDGLEVTIPPTIMDQR